MKAFDFFFSEFLNRDGTRLLQLVELLKFKSINYIKISYKISYIYKYTIFTRTLLWDPLTSSKQ